MGGIRYVSTYDILVDVLEICREDDFVMGNEGWRDSAVFGENDVVKMDFLMWCVSESAIDPGGKTGDFSAENTPAKYAK